MILYDHKPAKGMDALRRAYEMCSRDLALGYNLGLALYLDDEKERAQEVWSEVHKKHPDHLLTHANLAWVHFELGDDESAHILAFEGLKKHPDNMSLAHTKLFSLFRLGRYLEAYDWLARSNLVGQRVRKWHQQAVSYVVEDLWKRFRRGDQTEAIRRVVNLLVREYPEERAFQEAKDMLIQADIDLESEVPYPIALPHESWPKRGADVGQGRESLDARIDAMPPLNKWEKRTDAYALFYGINRYKNLSSRHYADRDALNFHRLMVRRGMFPNDPRHVRLRIDSEASGEVMRRDLDWLLTQGRINPNATLLLYYSGHMIPWKGPDPDGLPSGPGSKEPAVVMDGMMVPADARADLLNAETTLSLLRFKRRLDELNNPDVVLIIESCLNGQPPGCVFGDQGQQGLIEPATFQGGKPLMVSALHKLGLTYGPGRQGALTFGLLMGMLGDADGATGHTKDNWVDLNEAFLYARRWMTDIPLDMDPRLFQSSNIRLVKVGGER
jgi:tetratricopeptide (TPR) repeat protein